MQSIDEQKVKFLVLLNLSYAFDTVDHSILMKIWIQFGLIYFQNLISLFRYAHSNSNFIAGSYMSNWPLSRQLEVGGHVVVLYGRKASKTIYSSQMVSCYSGYSLLPLPYGPHQTISDSWPPCIIWMGDRSCPLSWNNSNALAKAHPWSMSNTTTLLVWSISYYSHQFSSGDVLLVS